MKNSFIKGLKSLFVTAFMLAAFSSTAFAQKATADFTKAEKQEITQILGSEFLVKFEGNRNLRIAPRGKADLLNVSESAISNPTTSAKPAFVVNYRGFNIVYTSGATVNSQLTEARVNRLNKVLGTNLQALATDNTR